MMYRFAFLSALFAGAAALSTPDEIPANSKLGSKLMSKARKVEQGQYYQNEEEQYNWVANYSIKFDQCHTVTTFGGEGAEGNAEEEGGTPHGQQHLVTFSLCESSSSCSKCKGPGKYVVNMGQFVEAYVEAKKEVEEAQCEAVQENCNCQYYYGDDNACLAKCYADAGLDFCGEEENEFNVEEYMECREAEFGNANYYASAYYVGPVCSSNGKKVHLNLFKDAQCTKKASSGVWEKYNYGATLPYSKESLVSTKECIDCQAGEMEYYNGYYRQNDEPLEMCAQLYEESGKCEKKLNQSNKNNDSCKFIHNVLPALEGVHKKQGKGSATFFAWLFFASTLAASGAAFFFFTKAERSTVDLSGNNNGSGIL
jgi:hypothetical protein